MGQYIGARYVPRFMGTYDATQTYEALDVVDNGLGTSYISKIPTPAGTPLTDTTHWAIYGASSGAIINLQNQIGDLTNLTTTDQDSLVDAINEVDANVKTLANRSLLIIGNSYVGYGAVDGFKNRFTHNYSFGGSGTGFLPYTGHSDTFESQLATAIASTTFDNDIITDIIFVSAMGDTRAYNEAPLTFEASINTAFASINTLISNNFPNCKRILITLAEAWDVTHFTDNVFANMFRVNKIFKKACNKINFEYLGWSGFQNLFVSSAVQADHYHPSTAGAALINNFINAAYDGHVEYVPKESSLATNVNYTTPTQATGGAKLSYTPDSVVLNIRGITCGSGESIALANGDAFIDTSAWTLPAPPPFQDQNLVCPCYDNNGSQINFLRLQLNISADGCLVIKALANPTVSTTSSATLQIATLSNISYNV